MTKNNKKLFFSLLMWMLLPSIYTLIRMNIVSLSGVDINILGQMEWFDLIDEILITTLTVPLYKLLKPTESSKEKNGAAFIVSFGVYFIFTLIISTYVSQITSFMNAEFATEFLRLQSFSMLISFISTFSIMLLTLNDNFKMVAILTIFKLAILSISDFIFISKFKDLGAAYSEIFTNSILSIILLIILIKMKYMTFKKFDFSWLKEYLKVGLFAGLQIFLDNFIYAIMICKMVNAVSESGNYWVANNFIWGWLLVPIMCINEIIKKDNFEKLSFRNIWKYGIYIVIFWIITIPGWKWFIENAISVDSGVILDILIPLVPFYLTYIISGFIDSWFISKGKTIYNTITSFIVNIGYYGITYILFSQGLFEANMSFIVYLFGCGMIVHMICSIIFYIKEVKLNVYSCKS